MFWKRKSEISITPLGGVGEVGRNCFLYESDGTALVIDCGVKPQTYKERKQSEEFWVTNPNWTVESPTRLDILDDIRRKKVIGIITHAHLDHIGAVAELSRRKIPVYLSEWSRLFLERYAGNLRIPMGARFINLSGNENLGHGDFRVSFIPLQHSIPGTFGVLISLKKKNVLHLGDFKFNGMEESINEFDGALREIRRKVGNLDCLVLDVLNVEMEGYTPPEVQAIDEIRRIVEEAKSRVMITLFSSNLQRIGKIIEIAQAQKKNVGISGRGMITSYNFIEGYSKKAFRIPAQDNQVLLIGGSQGEENSGLMKMVRGEHPVLKISPRDTVVFSSRCIPGNEQGLKILLEGLHRKGVRIILHEGEKEKLNLPFGVEERFLHVSGHGQRADIMKALEILEPKIIIPFHAPEEKCDLFENIAIAGNKRKIKRLQTGEALKIKI